MNCSTPYFLTCSCQAFMSSHSIGWPSLSNPMMISVVCDPPGYDRVAVSISPTNKFYVCKPQPIARHFYLIIYQKSHNDFFLEVVRNVLFYCSIIFFDHTITRTLSDSFLAASVIIISSSGGFRESTWHTHTELLYPWCGVTPNPSTAARKLSHIADFFLQPGQVEARLWLCCLEYVLLATLHARSTWYIHQDVLL